MYSRAWILICFLAIVPDSWATGAAPAPTPRGFNYAVPGLVGPILFPEVSVDQADILRTFFKSGIPIPGVSPAILEKIAQHAQITIRTPGQRNFFAPFVAMLGNAGVGDVVDVGNVISVVKEGIHSYQAHAEALLKVLENPKASEEERAAAMAGWGQMEYNRFEVFLHPSRHQALRMASLPGVGTIMRPMAERHWAVIQERMRMIAQALENASPTPEVLAAQAREVGKIDSGLPPEALAVDAFHEFRPAVVSAVWRTREWLLRQRLQEALNKAGPQHIQYIEEILMDMRVREGMRFMHDFPSERLYVIVISEMGIYLAQHGNPYHGAQTIAEIARRSASLHVKQTAINILVLHLYSNYYMPLDPTHEDDTLLNNMDVIAIQSNNRSLQEYLIEQLGTLSRRIQNQNYKNRLTKSIQAIETASLAQRPPEPPPPAD